jgi:DNA-directed RNA polymerase specialized sigma24 family protein
MFALLVDACSSAARRTGAVADPEALPSEADWLRRGYACLPLQQRIAVALVVLEQRSYRETAAVLDLSLATLTQQLWMGREWLQSQRPV